MLLCTVSDVIDLISDINDRVNDCTSRLNFGGCGVYASLLGEALERLGVDCAALVVDMERDSHEGLTPISELEEMMGEEAYYVDNWNSNGVDFNHILLAVEFPDGKYVVADSDCVVIGDEDEHSAITNGGMLYDGCISIPTLGRLVSDENAHSWNHWFDRGQIPMIRAIIEEAVGTFYRNARENGVAVAA